MFKSLTILLLWVGSCAGVVAQEAASPADSAHPVNFNGGWKFLRMQNAPADSAVRESAPGFDDAAWESATLPHTAHVEPLVANNMWQGVAWYRKHFTVSPAWSGKKVFVDFGAAMLVADVWINGRKATTHFGGYLPFSVDITGDLRAGDNVIAVRLDNRDNAEVPPGKSYKQLDFSWYGGLYRDVTLRVVNPLHITDPMQAGKPGSGGVFVTYPEISATSAAVQVRLHAVNETPAAMEGDFIPTMQSIAREEYPGDQCFTAGWQAGFDLFGEARQHGNTRNYHGDRPPIITE